MILRLRPTVLLRVLHQEEREPGADGRAPRNRVRTLPPPRDASMTDEPTEAALPPGHVPTVRIATPDPRSAKRHIRTRSGWAHYYMAACVVDFPKKYSETGSAPVEDIE